MDTLNVWAALRRNRWLVLPVLLLTVAGLGWAVLLRPATYQVASSVLLVPPPPAPSDAQVAQNPDLAKLNSDNPYGRSYDPTILIALVSIAVTSDPSREAIRRAGGDERFTVVQTTRYGFNSPFADITSAGSSPGAAIASNELVIKAFETELTRLQVKEKVSRRYLITARVAGDPASARVRSTDVGRIVVTVLGFGLFTTFTVVSVADALRQSRRRSGQPRSGP